MSVSWIDIRLSILLGRRKEPSQTLRDSVDKAFEIIEFEEMKELRTPQ